MMTAYLEKVKLKTLVYFLRGIKRHQRKSENSLDEHV